MNLICSAKEEIRRQGEAIKQRQEEEQRIKEEQALRIQEFAQQQKEERRLAVERRLPSEPAVDHSDPSTTIRFRLPGGKISTRRFLADNQLQVLLDFLLVEGYATEEFKVLSSWPRQDVIILFFFIRPSKIHSLIRLFIKVVHLECLRIEGLAQNVPFPLLNFSKLKVNGENLDLQYLIRHATF